MEVMRGGHVREPASPASDPHHTPACTTPASDPHAFFLRDLKGLSKESKISIRFGRSASLTGRLPQSEGKDVRGQKVAGRGSEVERSQDSPESPGKAPVGPVAPGSPARVGRSVGGRKGNR